MTSNSALDRTIPPSRLAEELQALWRNATPDTIGPAMVVARASLEAAPPPVREEVSEVMQSLEQLERWLRDR